MNELSGKRIAILVENGFEQSELFEPKRALEEAGAKTVIVSPAQDRVRAFRHDQWGDEIGVDEPIRDAHPEAFDGLLLPGGVINPDKLRMNLDAVRFVRAMFDAHKPIAAICHGPQMLIEADVVRGRTLTSWPSLRKDLENAGAHWVDDIAVVDGMLVTSRKPADIPEFNRSMIATFASIPVHKAA